MLSTIRLGQWGYYALRQKINVVIAAFRISAARHNQGLRKQMFGTGFRGGALLTSFATHSIRSSILFHLLLALLSVSTSPAL